MKNKTRSRQLIKRMIPRIIKASIVAIVLYFLLFFIPTLFTSKIVPSEYLSFIKIFAMITVFFAFITQLASGTIFQHLFGCAGSFTLTIFFIQVLKSGVISSSFGAISFLIDLRIIFAMLIAIELLEFAKNTFETIYFFSEKSEKLNMPITEH